SDMAFTKPYANETAEAIDSEARALIDEAYRMAEQVLTEHKEGLTALAELLLEREVIFTEDVERILGKRKKDMAKESEQPVEVIAPESASIE
ncbi:MAG: peptidase M41, partial [Alistipes sp.]|nr:peptidase M41 [Alistipes sp.]